MLERNTSPARVNTWLIQPSTKPEPMVLGFLIQASISEKLLRREIRKWSAERKFNFGEIVNFQHPRPPANIRPQRIEQAGGSRKNFAAPASKKARPRAAFCGGLAPHTVAAR